ncbi:MAG TPA: 2Fe-2S iron-sulfur cluster-binding protein, partial [Adhaeribacter sp.]|nr:2Fe-2S iron-sulfur cluster-binding protein [Adhaeribacter sp.]
MTRFLLNDQPVSTSLPPGLPLLDFVRYHQHLKGTKIGCREGDCGACTVLIGSLENGNLTYQSVTSCLMPLGNAQGKHVVTIEGLNLPDLSPVQQAIVTSNGTQCGFCTVGFVVSLTGYCLQPGTAEPGRAIAAMDGNICRCTGYKSLERAAGILVSELESRPPENGLAWLADSGFVPAYFKTVPEMLEKLAAAAAESAVTEPDPESSSFTLGGGTDLLVQQPETVRDSAVKLLWN